MGVAGGVTRDRNNVLLCRVTGASTDILKLFTAPLVYLESVGGGVGWAREWEGGVEQGRRVGGEGGGRRKGREVGNPGTHTQHRNVSQ